MNPNDVVLLNQDSFLKGPPLLADFSELCRLCLNKVTNPKTITGEHYKMSIKSLVEIYTFLKLPTDGEDALPPNICTECEDFLIQMHTFRCRCHYYNDILLKVSIKQENNKTVGEKEELGTFATISNQMTALTLKIFTCKECSVIFNDQKSYAAHVCGTKIPKVPTKKRKQLKSQGRSQCTVCGKLIARRHITDHMRIHTGEKPFKCKSCPASFANAGNLRRHMMIHTGEKPFVCSVCGFAFSQLVSLQAHEKTHSKKQKRKKQNTHCSNKDNYLPLIIRGIETPFRFCKHCRIGFVNFEKFEQHSLIHHQGDAENPLESFIQVTQQDGSTLLQCKEAECGKTFSNPQALAQHAHQHTSSLPYTCNECNKVFKSYAGILHHLLCTYTNDRQFECKICKKKFFTPLVLKSHMLIHTGDKEFACKVCSRTFRQVTHLHSHMRTHNGEKPYVCDVCGQAFAQNGNLTVHKRMHTGEVPYACSVCGKGFRDSSTRKKHEQTTHDKHTFAKRTIQLSDSKEQQIALKSDPDWNGGVK